MRVLGFSCASHGNSIATLSVSDARVNSRDLPTHNWPTAPLPQFKYPFSPNQHENVAAEGECLEQIRAMIQANRDASSDIAAIIIEPISAFENRQATPMFYKSLRLMAKTEGIPFIVDETRTGVGATGKMWGHEHWYLNDRDGGAPDIVTFGGRAGISGYYSSRDFVNDAGFEQNINMVDVLSFGATWQAI
jgi:4-aminobutyrate aminotransferase/(S)-3-amino-2-methylpropionate transaminase